MANWGIPKNPQIMNLKGLDENDLAMRIMLSQKPGSDLIQNCDLPPPTKKLLSGLSENVTVINYPMNRKLHFKEDDDYDDGEKKLGLLKALRLSQTRAREAEAKYAELSKEKDAIAIAFVHDSMQILAYRQFVRLLEFQVLQLQKKQQLLQRGKMKKDDDDDDGLTLLITMALCLGIAGVGLAIGRKYFSCYI